MYLHHRSQAGRILGFVASGTEVATDLPPADLDAIQIKHVLVNLSLVRREPLETPTQLLRSALRAWKRLE